MLIEIAVKLLIPVIIGFFLGLYIDKMISTTPIIAIVFSIIGMFAGMYIVFKQYSKGN
ncbi:MAG: AtpZ/AtpI family protein [Cyanobacteriota bacterium]